MIRVMFMKKYIAMLTIVLLLAGSITALSVFAGTYGAGDANRDGTVNIKDATAIQRYCAFLQNFSDEELRLADGDADGTVNIKDATIIQKYIAGLVEGFPAETMTEASSSETSTDCETDITEVTESSADIQESTTEVQENTITDETEPSGKTEPTEETEPSVPQTTIPPEPQVTPPSKDNDGYFNQIVRP